MSKRKGVAVLQACSINYGRESAYDYNGFKGYRSTGWHTVEMTICCDDVALERFREFFLSQFDVDIPPQGRAVPELGEGMKRLKP